MPSKPILITGGAGSLGQELVRIMLDQTDSVIRVLDINDEKLNELRQKWGDDRVRYLYKDVTNYWDIYEAMENVGTIIHAAASKHVWVGTFNPNTVRRVNVDGTENVIRAAKERLVDRVVFVSTDKAVNPSTIYGTCKKLAEDSILHAHYTKGDKPTRFVVFRSGNFFLSSGNVVTRWITQAYNGEDVTVTRGGMKRYFIGVNRVAALLVKHLYDFESGCVYIPKMREYSIEEIGELFGNVIWKNPEAGEKLREELWTVEEAQRLVELEELYKVNPKPLF